jgi:hypothetical protein
MNKEIRVYIASPYTKGWMPSNVRLQLETTDKLIDLGYIPYTPLLMHFQEIYSSKDEHVWLKIDFEFLKVCDAVLRIKPIGKDGKEIPSAGADLEEQLANEEGIPVFYNIEELNDWFKARSTQSKLNI